MSPSEAAMILFGAFGLFILIRVPVSFALGLACVPILYLDQKLTPIVLCNEMWKSYNSFILLSVPFFLLAAHLMNAAGITERLVALARASVGHLPGGLAHVNVLVSMLFAGVSGSSTAEAAGIGSILIPAMKKQGYDSSFSVAITACASVMGVIIPPSILMVVWGGLMSVSISGLFLAGIVPGVLIGLFMMATVLVFAKKRGYPVYQRSTLEDFFVALRGASLALLTPAIIVGGIVGGLFTATEASLIAVLYSCGLGVIIYRSIGLREFQRVVYESASFSAVALFCIGTASAFGWLLAYYRVPQALVEQVAGFGNDATTAGFVIAGVFLLVGMFIDAIPAIIVVGTVLMPVAEQAGMHPIHFAIIGVISLAFGLVTPPYGLCLLIAASIGQIRVVEALRDVGIILLPMLFLLCLVILFPDLVLFLPRMLIPDLL
ncbi:MAG: TRAP transporter large permease [Pirellula sp.]